MALTRRDDAPSGGTTTTSSMIPLTPHNNLAYGAATTTTTTTTTTSDAMTTTLNKNFSSKSFDGAAHLPGIVHIPASLARSMAEAPEKVLIVLDLDHHFGAGFGDEVMGPRAIAVVTAITRQLEHPVAAVTARSNGMLNLITQRVFPIHASNHYEWVCSSLEEPEELPEGSGTKERAIDEIVEKVATNTRLGKITPVGLNSGIADRHVADILEFLYWSLIQARARSMQSKQVSSVSHRNSSARHAVTKSFELVAATEYI